MKFVAYREFDLDSQEHGRQKVRIGILPPFRPWPDDPDDWCCVVIIERPERVITTSSGGVDSMQALLNALRYLEDEVVDLKITFGSDITFVECQELWISSGEEMETDGEP